MKAIKISKTYVYFLVDYHPYKVLGQHNPSFDLHSSKILDIKYNRDPGYEFFYPILLDSINEIRTKHDIDSIALVPSHEKETFSPMMHKLVNTVADVLPIDNFVGVLKRHTTNPKNVRSFKNHVSTIEVNKEAVKNRKILLIDDVVTTGASMLACKYLLKTSEASSIICLALARDYMEFKPNLEVFEM
jgi:predicted amidophosphoribosyltransferase